MNYFKSLFVIFSLSLMMVGCQDDDLAIANNLDPEIELNMGIDVYVASKFEEGYTLVAPFSSNSTYLVDMEGFVVKKWTSSHRGLSVKMSKEGELFRTYRIPESNFAFPGATGGIEKFDFDGNLVWDWQYSTEDYILHHDIVVLDNGNILASVWDKKNEEEAIENGRNPSLLFNREVWPDRIIEVEPQGSNSARIVWEWSIWDHLVQDYDETKLNYGNVAENPQLVDINYTIGDANFNHVNSLFYIEQFDQIIFSTRRFNEFMVIDHSTSTAEAASHSGGKYGKGGDLLYRWGNPAAYKVADAESQRLFGQHDVTFVPQDISKGGNFLVFNNNRFDNLSSVDELLIPVQPDGSYQLLPGIDNHPDAVVWTYTNNDIFADRVSGARRLPNGNTLITEGTTGTLYEIDNQNTIVWQFTIPLEDNDVFKCFRYSIDEPPFNGNKLSRLEIPIE
jgi:hypothetical protein